MTLTAEDARLLMPQRRVEHILGLLEEKIKAAAEKGFGFIRMSSIGDYARDTINAGYDSEKKAKGTAGGQALTILEQRGFKVKFLYEERQFVDMDYIIRWGDEE